MKPWLSYTFDEPASSLPEFTPGISSFTPCHYWWRPSIYCEPLSVAAGAYYPATPFPSANIREIYVESVRVYHLLCRHEYAETWEGVVRILSPIPAPPVTHDKTINVYAFGYDAQSVVIGGQIIAKLGGCVSMFPALLQDALESARVVVFPNGAEDTSLYLCAAISAGCKIVASDAGSSEEYLSKYAPAGTWHVIHNHDASVYEQAARHLLGMESTFNQSMYIDEAPYE